MNDTTSITFAIIALGYMVAAHGAGRHCKNGLATPWSALSAVFVGLAIAAIVWY